MPRFAHAASTPSFTVTYGRTGSCSGLGVGWVKYVQSPYCARMSSAFDPMTATFLLPFAMGACTAVGGDIVTDAFGVVAMVAMTPLITIQILGLVYRLKSRRAGELIAAPAPADAFSMLGDYDIIEL